MGSPEEKRPLGRQRHRWEDNIKMDLRETKLIIIRNLKSRRLRWAGHVARMEQSRYTYRVLVGKPEGKRPLGRPKSRWENNNK